MHNYRHRHTSYSHPLELFRHLVDKDEQQCGPSNGNLFCLYYTKKYTAMIRNYLTIVHLLLQKSSIITLFSAALCLASN